MVSNHSSHILTTMTLHPSPTMTLAIVDVDYRAHGARAACVVAPLGYWSHTLWP